MEQTLAGLDMALLARRQILKGGADPVAKANEGFALRGGEGGELHPWRVY